LAPSDTIIVPVGGPPVVQPVPTGETASDWSMCPCEKIVEFWVDSGVAWFIEPCPPYSECAGVTVPWAENTDLARLTSPSPGGTLVATSHTVTWAAATGATEYWLTIGSLDQGFGDDSYWDATCGTNTSQAVTGLPDDGRDLCIRLWTQMASEPYWRHNDYVVEAYDAP